ncbi:unnamed protein product [Prorocentrum cordatum]|uniref:Uncharacterized protein n=1 Tax=Prorocentrum cordatum TaxID=2364126 RepID=A0ABN9QJU0_9DINO|nr:unnamed protein product [Polarella glacialis]
MRDELLSNIRSALDDPLATAGVGRPADEAPSDDDGYLDSQLLSAASGRFTDLQTRIEELRNDLAAVRCNPGDGALERRERLEKTELMRHLCFEYDALQEEAAEKLRVFAMTIDAFNDAQSGRSWLSRIVKRFEIAFVIVDEVHQANFGEIRHRPATEFLREPRPDRAGNYYEWQMACHGKSRARAWDHVPADSVSPLPSGGSSVDLSIVPRTAMRFVFYRGARWIPSLSRGALADDAAEVTNVDVACRSFRRHFSQMLCEGLFFLRALARGEVGKRVGGPRMSLESTTKAVLTMILANDVGANFATLVRGALEDEEVRAAFGLPDFVADAPKLWPVMDDDCLRGGDNGITETCMRQARLLPEPSKPKPSGQSSAAAPPPGVDFEVGAGGSQETVGPMAQLRCRLLGQMLERSFDALTFSYFKQIHTGQIQSLSEKKPTVWKAMESSGWYKAGLRGKAKETVLPKLLTIRKYSDLVPDPNVEVPAVPPEQWGRAALGCYANDNACRKRNVDIMISVLAAAPKPRGRKKRGAEPEVGDNAHLRRKIIVKRSASGGIDVAERSIPYTYKRTAARRFAEGPAAQGCPARVLHAMLQGTVDLDIHSAVLTIVWQLVEQLGMADKDLVKEELEMLKRLAEDRGEALRGELPDMGPQAAKRFVLETIGGSRSFDADAMPFAKKLQRVSRVLRWLACSALPEVYGGFCRDAALGDGEKTEKWPEGQTFSAFYRRAEDYILREWHTWVLTQPVKHLSLHFDGVRISRDAVLARHASVADYAADASAHVAKETGFVVKIKEKTHPTIAEALTSCGAWVSAPVVSSFSATSVENNAARVEKGRTYAECCLSHGVSMTPQLGFDACEQGFDLLHMDGHGSPSCALVHAGAELDKATVYFCDKAGEMNLEELRDAVLVRRDSRLSVTFHIDLPLRRRRIRCVSGVKRSIENVSIQLLSSTGELEDDERPATPDPYLPDVSKRQWEAKVVAWRREMSQLLDEVPIGATELAAAEELGVWVEPSPPAVRGCPFRALEHGNQWLSHLGFALIRQPRGPTGPGRYVKWGPPRRETGLAASVGHFAAAILRPGNATVIDRRAGLPAVREWLARGDIPDVEVPQVLCDFSLELPRLPKIRLLERLNAHPRDSQLHFVEESHTYYISGARTHGSVTGLIHEYCSVFDAGAVIGKMRSGRNWPRPDYLRHPRPEDVVAELRATAEAARLHELLVSHGACDAEICAEMKATARAAPRLANQLEGLSLSDHEIVEKWRLDKEEAARRGTWMHWTFEAHLDRVPVSHDAVEFQLFLEFLGALEGLAAFRAEWAIFAEHEGLAGSIDFVARDSAGSLCIYDWKRGNHYLVQLNIYRWMLEHYYGARVAAMYVFCLHPDNGDQPFVDDVPVIPDIEEPMAIQRTRPRELRAMASEDAREIDPLGGWPRPVVAARLPHCLSTAANFDRAFRQMSVDVAHWRRIKGKSTADDVGEGWVRLAAEQREPHELADVGSADAPEFPSGDEGETAVRTELFECLEKEVKSYAAGVALLRPKRDSECVKLKFALLATHVSKYHLRKTRFVASGTKQFNVVCALFDNDRLLRTPAGSLLKRSATILRETVSPAVHCGQNAIDKDIVLVLDDDGPSYQNKAAVGHNLACRRVGHTCYTRGFAEILLQESLRHHGRVRPAMSRTCARVVEQGSELSSMLPTRVDHWLKLMGDVFNSAHVEMRSAALMEECHRHEEFLHVSMGASISMDASLHVKGQADYRSAQAARDAAPVPDVDAKRRVLTLAGRTGAALGVFLTKDEGADEIAGALAARWSAARRSQTVSVACHQPSSALFQALRGSAFPNLFILSLDPVHLPITYEETHWREKTVGSRLLRILMAKFTKVDCALPAHYWGAPFDGANAPNLRPIEERARAQILDHSLAKSRSQHVIDHVNAELPWKTTHELIEAIAALSALVPEELARRTHVNNVQLKRLLCNATAPARMQWFFNNQRFRHSLPAARLALLGSGTSVNEPFNHEINTWFRNQGDIYASTAELQLRIGLSGKLQAHSCALHMPTLRQLRQANVLSRSVMAWALPGDHWKSYCALQAQCGADVLAPARLPLREVLRRDTFEDWPSRKPVLRALLRYVLPRGSHVADFCGRSGQVSRFLNDTGLVNAYAFDPSPNIRTLTKGSVDYARLHAVPLGPFWRTFDVILCLSAVGEESRLRASDQSWKE